MSDATRLASRRHELPDEVGELLRAVRVAAGDLEQPRRAPPSSIPFPVAREALAEEAGELRRRDRPDLELLRAAPERLVLVVEDPLEDVPLAAEVDVAHLRLRLEDRAHQVRVAACRARGSPGTRRRSSRRAVSVRPRSRRAARAAARSCRRCRLGGAPAWKQKRSEPSRGSTSIDGTTRRPRKSSAARSSTCPRASRYPVDRLRKRGGEPLLRRRPHQVAVADERFSPRRPLRRAQHERRLAVAARGVHEHVLAVSHVGDELAQLAARGR